MAVAYLKKLIPFVLEPVVEVDDENALRKARLLSAILLMLIPSLIAASRWPWLNTRFVPVLYAGLALLIVAFILNRLGKYSMAGGITLACATAAPYCGLLVHGQGWQVGVNALLIYTIASVMLAYLLFPPMIVVIIFVANIAAIGTAPLFVPSLPPQPLLFTLFFFMTFSVLILIAAALRKYDQDQIERQSRALAESEARYHRLLEAAFEAIVVHEDGVLLDANPAFEVMVGRPVLSSEGPPSLAQFLAPEHQDILRPDFDAGSFGPYLATLIRADETRLQVEVLTKTLAYKDRNARVIAIRDVTERLQAEAERLELSLEREKSKVLLRFMSNLSHDLRTPLTVIKTSLYLLDRLIDDPVQREHQMHVLHAQTEHLRRLMDDILNMSSLDRADTDEFTFKLTDINPTLAQCVEENRALVDRKGHTLVFTRRDELPGVLADELQLKRMLKHILLNAINYTPCPGTIAVESDVIADQVVIRVRDTGIGIAPEDMPYIYDYFYRAEPARNSDRGGTGLGLSIAKKIVEAHGGTIAAESTPEIGTTFTIRLPAVRHSTGLQVDGEPSLSTVESI